MKDCATRLTAVESAPRTDDKRDNTKPLRMSSVFYWRTKHEMNDRTIPLTLKTITGVCAFFKRPMKIEVSESFVATEGSNWLKELILARCSNKKFHLACHFYCRLSNAIRIHCKEISGWVQIHGPVHPINPKTLYLTTSPKSPILNNNLPQRGHLGHPLD